MSTPEAAAPRPHSAVVTAYLPPDGVLYDERTGQVYRLNPSAAAVWMLLDGTADVDAVAEEISEIFEVGVDQVRPDVQTAVEQFARQGLLVRDGDVPEPAGDRLRLPERLRVTPAAIPVEGEIAVPLPVFTRGGQAVLVHRPPGEHLDGERLQQAGIAEVDGGWAFVASDGASVAAGGLRWPLRGVLVLDKAGSAVDVALDAARGLLWPLARGDRPEWERLLGTDGWVSVADGDAEAALEAALA